MVEKKCISTKKSISNDSGSVVFPCPKCGNTTIRSKEARQNYAPYKCPNCGFTGP